MKRLVLLLEILISLFFLPHGLTQHLIKPEFVNLLENNPEWSMIGNIVLEESEYRGDIVQRLHNVLVSLKSSSFPTAVASNISQKCIDDSQTYVHSLYTSLSQWALQSKALLIFLLLAFYLLYSICKDFFVESFNNLCDL